MERISLEQLILGVRNSYIDINKEYDKLNDYIFCEKKGVKEFHFYFGKDIRGNNNLICSVIDTLCIGDDGAKDIVYKSYANDYLINGYHLYKIDVIDNNSFSKVVDNILSSEFMVNRPYTIKVEDKIIKINPESIELSQKIIESKQKKITDIEPASKLVHKEDDGYETLLVYKGIDDYILTTDLYDKDYLRELKIFKSTLNNYYRNMIERESNLRINNSKIALDKKSEYNIEKLDKGYKLALRPDKSRHID